MLYNFEWDPGKARSNVRKHGVTFEQATEVFLDPLHLTVFDDDHSEDEERWSTLGKLKNNQYIVVIHTFEEHSDQSTMVRIISARKATQREQQQYEEN